MREAAATRDSPWTAPSEAPAPTRGGASRDPPAKTPKTAREAARTRDSAWTAPSEAPPRVPPAKSPDEPRARLPRPGTRHGPHHRGRPPPPTEAPPETHQ